MNGSVFGSNAGSSGGKKKSVIKNKTNNNLLYIQAELKQK